MNTVRPMSTLNLGVMPRETKVALLLLWVALVAGLALVLMVTARNWAVVSSQSAGWWVAAYWGYPVSALLLVALGRGYGWVRWLFLISFIFLVVVFFANVGAWAREDSDGLAIFAIVEPLVMLLRVAALALLFRPMSNNWYAGRRSVPEQV